MGKQAREAVTITTLLQPLGIRGLGRRPWVLLVIYKTKKLRLQVGIPTFSPLQFLSQYFGDDIQSFWLFFLVILQNMMWNIVFMIQEMAVNDV